MHLLVLTNGLYLNVWWWKVTQYTQIIATGAMTLLLITVSILDYRRVSHRDWLHWTGVCVVVVISLLYAVDTTFWLISG